MSRDSRATLGWTLARAYSIGNSDMRVLLKHRPGAGTRLRGSGKIARRALVVAAAGRHPLRQVRIAGWRPCTKLSRAAGKLTAMAGRRYNEYAVIHGE